MCQFRPSDGFRTTRVSRVSRGVCAYVCVPMSVRTDLVRVEQRAYVCVPMSVRTDFVRVEPRATTLNKLFNLCSVVKPDMLSERERKK